MLHQINIDLEEILLHRLQQEADRQGRTVGELINLLLSRSLAELEAAVPPKPRFTVRAKALQAFPEVDFSSTSRLLDSLGEERYPG